MALLVLWSLKVVFCWAWDELKQNFRLSATKVSFFWIGPTDFIPNTPTPC